MNIFVYGHKYKKYANQTSSISVGKEAKKKLNYVEKK